MENWKLTEEEENKLTEEDLKKYKKALSYREHYWARGLWGGWERGNDLLKELGWIEQRLTEGRTTFVSLIKPQILKI